MSIKHNVVKIVAVAAMVISVESFASKFKDLKKGTLFTLNSDGSKWVVCENRSSPYYQYGLGDVKEETISFCSQSPSSTFLGIPVSYHTKTFVTRFTQDVKDKNKWIESESVGFHRTKYSLYAKALPVVSALASIGGAYAWLNGSKKK